MSLLVHLCKQSTEKEEVTIHVSVVSLFSDNEWNKRMNAMGINHWGGIEEKPMFYSCFVLSSNDGSNGISDYLAE